VRESDAAALAGQLCQANEVHTSPIAIYQAVLGLARLGNTSIQEAEAVLERFREEVQAQTMSISAEVDLSAIAAFDRFRKGRHPAGLNMGDCFACACANELDVPLLFKGDDFPLTDITIA
jgi:ribonuclease VapC